MLIARGDENGIRGVSVIGCRDEILELLLVMGRMGPGEILGDSATRLVGRAPSVSLIDPNENISAVTAQSGCYTKYTRLECPPRKRKLVRMLTIRHSISCCPRAF